MIKHRAQSIFGRQWIYGQAVKLPYCFSFMIEEKESTKKFGDVCIENTDDVKYFGAPIFDETICQNSTVKDKNGVEMYEGDIVYGAAYWLERYKPAVVAFRNGSFGLLWHRGDIEEFDPFTSICNVEYEVVGNIYDNPELMEEK